MRNKLSLVFFCFALFGCRQNNKSSSEKPRHITDSYKKQEAFMDSLNKSQGFINAKWWLYCWQCDDFVKDLYQFHDTGVITCNLTMGELDLVFKKIVTSEKYATYFFEYQPTNGCHIKQAIPKKLIHNAITVQISNDSVCAFAEEGEQLAAWSGANPKSRLYNPLQPEVMKYLKENRDKIHPWFREEAVRQGVFKD